MINKIYRKPIEAICVAYRGRFYPYGIYRHRHNLPVSGAALQPLQPSIKGCHRAEETKNHNSAASQAHILQTHLCQLLGVDDVDV